MHGHVKAKYLFVIFIFAGFKFFAVNIYCYLDENNKNLG
jgi:hypothetical protein